MNRGYPSLLCEDIPDIPCSMVRERPDMFQHLRSKYLPEGMKLQDMVHLLKGSSAICQAHEDMSLEKRSESLIKFAADNALPMPNDHVQNIAIAGLFYNGIGCTLTCYYCDCNVIDWKLGDDPWIRHSELQPNCPVIKMHQMARPLSNTTFRRSVSCPSPAVCGTAVATSMDRTLVYVRV